MHTLTTTQIRTDPDPDPGIDPDLYPYNQTIFEMGFMEQIGIPFTQSSTVYIDQPIGNPIKLASQIHNKWRPQVPKQELEEPLIEIVL